MCRDSRWLLEVAYAVRNRALARPFDDYPPAAVNAILAHGESALNSAVDEARRREERWVARQEADVARRKGGRLGPPRRLEKPTEWRQPILTGDPVADEWERAIARGEIPDFNRRRKR